MTLPVRIDTIEQIYEYLLAYAAQGVVQEDAAPGPGVRGPLQDLAAALDGLARAAQSDAAGLPANLAAAWQAFLPVLAEDAGRALKAVRLVLACPSISSQLVDNLNASLHLRTLLTDLFLLDEAAKPVAGGG